MKVKKSNVVMDLNVINFINGNIAIFFITAKIKLFLSGDSQVVLNQDGFYDSMMFMKTGHNWLMY